MGARKYIGIFLIATPVTWLLIRVGIDTILTADREPPATIWLVTGAVSLLLGIVLVCLDYRRKKWLETMPFIGD